MINSASLMDVCFTCRALPEHSKCRDRRGYYQKFVRRCHERERDGMSVQSAGAAAAAAAAIAAAC